MATRSRSGADGTGIVLARQLLEGTRVRTNNVPFESYVAPTQQLATGADVAAAGAVDLESFRGAGPLVITNSAAGAGVYTVSGEDEDGNAQTETITFLATESERTTGFRSLVGTTAIGTGINVTAIGAVTLTAFTGTGPITITINTAGAGALEVSGVDENGDAASETLTFAATDTTMTTVNNYRNDGLSIEVTTAFTGSRTAEISVATIAFFLANNYRSENLVLTVATAFGSGRTADVNITTIDHQVAGAIQKVFPCSAVDFGEDADIQESDLITALGADTEDEIGQYWSTGSFTTRILIEDIIHFLRGYFNPQGYINSYALPVATALASQVGDPSGDITLTQLTAQHGALATPALPAANWTGQLRLILTGTPTFASDARMRITGYRAIGRPNRDRFYKTEDVPISANTVTSANFWRNATNVNISGVTGATGYSLVWVPDTYVTEFMFSTQDPQSPGYTAMPIQGGVPGITEDWIMNTFNMNATPSAINVTIEGTGSRYDAYQTLEGGDVEQLFIPAADYTAHFPTADLRSYKGSLGAFSFGDDIVKYTSIDIGMNRNYQPEEGADGSAFRRGVEATRTRQITFAPTTRFESGDEATDTFLRWQQIFRDQERQNLAMRMYAFSNVGQQNRFDIIANSAQLNASPRTPVTGPGPIDRTLSFKALPRPGVSESEILFRVYTQAAYTEA